MTKQLHDAQEDHVCPGIRVVQLSTLPVMMIAARKLKPNVACNNKLQVTAEAEVRSTVAIFPCALRPRRDQQSDRTNKAKTPEDQPCVEVKRCSFQPGEEDLSESAPLGVFATCDPRRRTLTAREPREVNLESSPLEATPLTFALATRSLPGWFSSSYFVAAAVLFTWIRGCGRNICSYHFRF
jgi:hypothetical protein